MLGATATAGASVSDLQTRLQNNLGDRYTIARELGRGGMATVFLATDVRHRRQVALKLLNPDVSAAVGAERFEREIEIAARLTHPNILALHESGEADHLLYYVMPFVAGETLRARLESQGRLAVSEATRLLIEAADALDYAHRSGVVHRDVKPENIMLADGHAVVADFGIAQAVSEAGGDRLTATGLALGTPGYMSPEQAAGDRTIDGRSDVFSLGAVAYEMLAGTRPFTGPTAAATLARVLTAPVRPLRQLRDDVSPELEAIILRALEKDPSERFQTAAELVAALRSVIPTRPLTVTDRLTRSSPRSRAAAVAAGVVVLALAGAVLARGRFSGAARDGRDAESVRSIAVLPFANESGDTANAYLGAGIAEEILNALADVPGIRVASRTSSFAPRNAGVDVRELGRRLDVSTILEGSVRRAGATMRVTARLVSTQDDRPLWDENFDRAAAAMFDVQEEIARAIVTRLRVRISDVGDGRIIRSRTTSVEAHDLVLRARAALEPASREAGLEALRLLNRAIALDSGYADAYAALQGAYLNIAVFGDQVALPGEQGATGGELLRRARVAAARAVVLDSTSSAAHRALGQAIFRYDWDWQAAERHLQYAVRLNPTSGETYQAYSRVLRSMGRFDDARRTLDSARKYLPPGTVRGRSTGRISYFARDFERAIRETLSDFDTTGRTTANWLAEAYIGAGQFAKAESILVHTDAVKEPTTPISLAHIDALTGRPAQARALLTNYAESTSGLLVLSAGVHASLGDTASAFRDLERAVVTHDPLVVDLKVDPRLDPLRKFPHFAELLRRLRFPP